LAAGFRGRSVEGRRVGRSADAKVTDSKNEALRCSAGFEEFGKLYLEDAEAAGFELGAEVRADLIEENCPADIDRVAGEAEGVGFVDCDAV
jgi:hypothetical protein